jgi:hypothetical protein
MHNSIYVIGICRIGVRVGPSWRVDVQTTQNTTFIQRYHRVRECFAVKEFLLMPLQVLQILLEREPVSGPRATKPGT